jgi:urea transport system substrate-binding protein
VSIHLWAQAVEKAKSTGADKMREAMAGQSFAAPSGFTLTMGKTSHHLRKPVMIGEINADDQFNACGKPSSRSALNLRVRSFQAKTRSMTIR